MERPYIDFEYYSGTFGGTKIPEDGFAAYARKASLKMDTFTFGRLQRWGAADLPDSVFDACCAIAEVMYEYDEKQSAIAEATGGGVLKSENNDGYSVSFATTDRVADTKSINSEVGGIVETYLGHSGLLFRGVSRKWDSK